MTNNKYEYIRSLTGPTNDVLRLSYIKSTDFNQYNIPSILINGDNSANGLCIIEEYVSGV